MGVLRHNQPGVEVEGNTLKINGDKYTFVGGEGKLYQLGPYFPKNNTIVVEDRVTRRYALYRIEVTENGVTLTKEVGDPTLPKELYLIKKEPIDLGLVEEIPSKKNPSKKKQKEKGGKDKSQGRIDLTTNKGLHGYTPGEPKLDVKINPEDIPTPIGDTGEKKKKKGTEGTEKIPLKEGLPSEVEQPKVSPPSPIRHQH